MGHDLKTGLLYAGAYGDNYHFYGSIISCKDMLCNHPQHDIGTASGTYITLET